MMMMMNDDGGDGDGDGEGDGDETGDVACITFFLTGRSAIAMHSDAAGLSMETSCPDTCILLSTDVRQSLCGCLVAC
jgi:hypothetical protein